MQQKLVEVILNHTLIVKLHFQEYEAVTEKWVNLGNVTL